MSSSSPQNPNRQLESSTSINYLFSQNYIETWLSPAAFHRIWENENMLPIRFHFDIDMEEQQESFPLS